MGWCSIVRLAPRIHRPWAVGAISPGLRPARRSRRRGRRPRRPARRLPGAPARAPRARCAGRARRLAGHHALGLAGVAEHLSVNLLTRPPRFRQLSPVPEFHVPPARAPLCAQARSTVGEKLGLEPVMSQQPRCPVARWLARRHPPDRKRAASAEHLHCLAQLIVTVEHLKLLLSNYQTRVLRAHI